MKHQIDPTMDYLESMKNAGANLTDFEATKINTDIYRVIVHVDGSSSLEFLMKSDPLRFMDHFREAVAFTGFGSRGLGNLIYADACDKAKEFSVPKDRVKILLSEKCFDRIRDNFVQWTQYGLQIHVQPSILDFGYAIEVVPESNL